MEERREQPSPCPCFLTSRAVSPAGASAGELLPAADFKLLGYESRIQRLWMPKGLRGHWNWSCVSRMENRDLETCS